VLVAVAGHLSNQLRVDVPPIAQICLVAQESAWRVVCAATIEHPIHRLQVLLSWRFAPVPSAARASGDDSPGIPGLSIAYDRARCHLVALDAARRGLARDDCRSTIAPGLGVEGTEWQRD